MDKKMSHKRLLGIDLDGTLLDDHKLISQENLAGLKKGPKARYNHRHRHRQARGRGLGCDW